MISGTYSFDIIVYNFHPLYSYNLLLLYYLFFPSLRGPGRLLLSEPCGRLLFLWCISFQGLFRVPWVPPLQGSTLGPRLVFITLFDLLVLVISSSSPSNLPCLLFCMGLLWGSVCYSVFVYLWFFPTLIFSWWPG